MFLASITIIIACIGIVPAAESSRIRLGPKFTTHLCTIHPWPELCDTDFERVVRPVPVLSLPSRHEYRMRALQPGSNSNDAKKLLRALRSIQMDEDKLEADKKSEKTSYDFIRFGK
ncbi:hypothetical protein M3Y97_00375700 [Aphelenchoides bicaudatus]|nr:hypothetical protein M3Y97_00375700 [Aphelenchoides bicaudatus]